MRLIDAYELEREMYRRCIDTDIEIEKGRAKWDSGLWIRYKVFEDAITVAPRIEAEPIGLPYAGRWTPVTDGLPEKEGEYLVCCNSKYQFEVARFYIDEEDDRWFGCDWNDHEDVVAWMPLPAPYKGCEKE